MDVGTTMRVIFLDFDGVLNNVGHWIWMDKYSNIHRDRQNQTLDHVNLTNLGWIIRACNTSADPINVIISSTWGNLFSLDALKDFLHPYVNRKYVIGVTPRKFSGTTRGHEISMAIEKWDVGKHAILDDYDDGISASHKDNFFRMDSRDGLTHSKAMEIAEHFGVVNKMPVYLI